MGVVQEQSSAHPSPSTGYIICKRVRGLAVQNATCSFIMQCTMQLPPSSGQLPPLNLGTSDAGRQPAHSIDHITHSQVRLPCASKCSIGDIFLSCPCCLAHLLCRTVQISPAVTYPVQVLLVCCIFTH